MTSKYSKRSVIVGVFIFLGIVLLIIGVLAVGNVRRTFTKTIMVSSIFDDVEGLKVGNNVWFSGVKVGTVKKLEFVGLSQVRVIYRIEENAQSHIHKDVKAKIGSEGLIGNKIIVLFGGSGKAGIVDDGDEIKTESTISTEEMMTTLQSSNQNLQAITDDFKLITQQMREGQGTLGQLLKEEKLYESLEQTVASLRQASANAQRITASLAQFSNRMDDPGTLAHGLTIDTTLMPRLEETVVQLERMTEEAQNVAAKIRTATDDNGTPVGVLLNDDQAARDLQQTIRNLEASTKKFDENMEALQHNFLLRGFFKKRDKKTN